MEPEFQKDLKYYGSAALGGGLMGSMAVFVSERMIDACMAYDQMQNSVLFSGAQTIPEYAPVGAAVGAAVTVALAFMAKRI